MPVKQGNHHIGLKKHSLSVEFIWIFFQNTVASDFRKQIWVLQPFNQTPTWTKPGPEIFSTLALWRTMLNLNLFQPTKKSNMAPVSSIRVWNLGPEKPTKNRPFGAEIWHPNRGSRFPDLGISNFLKGQSHCCSRLLFVFSRRKGCIDVECVRKCPAAERNSHYPCNWPQFMSPKSCSWTLKEGTPGWIAHTCHRQHKVLQSLTFLKISSL